MRDLHAILDLPRADQPAALRALRATVAVPTDEAWNTRFGPLSLFDTWTRTSLMRTLYDANRQVLSGLVARPGFRIIEIGGGNGRLWEFLPATAVGELLIIDPMADVAAEVQRVLPRGVRLSARIGRVEDAALPDADAVVCSLTLHHVAGISARDRAAYGLSGPGKREVLEAFANCTRPNNGFILLNEADVYCDLPLAPADPILEDRLLDSYVRRCARALLDDWAVAEPDTRRRLEALIWRWCVDQLDLAAVARADRDVYELDVPRWLALFDEVGLTVQSRQFTDRHGLFCQYTLR